MPNSSNQFEDQAHELRQRMKDNEHSSEQTSKNEVTNMQNESDIYFHEHKSDMDILNLPPRSVIHTDKKTGWKWKMRYPLIRLLMVIFILLIIMLPLYHAWKNKSEEQAPLTNADNQQNAVGETVWMKEKEDTTSPPIEATPVSSSDSVDKTSNIENSNQRSVHSSNQTEHKPETNGNQTDKTNESNQQKTTTQEENVVTKYQVKKGDTLYSIAVNFYGGKYGEEIIRKENNLKSNSIYVGQWLKIPKEQ